MEPLINRQYFTSAAAFQAAANEGLLRYLSRKRRGLKSRCCYVVYRE